MRDRSVKWFDCDHCGSHLGEPEGKCPRCGGFVGFMETLPPEIVEAIERRAKLEGMRAGVTLAAKWNDHSVDVYLSRLESEEKK